MFSSPYHHKAKESQRKPCISENFCLIFTTKCNFTVDGGDNMIKTTAMLLQQYNNYANPKALF
jgi:hypothetical protein